MTYSPHPHWIQRARLAHDRLATDGGQRETTHERLGGQYNVQREVAQYHLAFREGYITEQTFRRAKQRLEAEHDSA